METMSSNSFKELIRTSIIFEGQPTIYYIITFYWAKINNSIFFLRLLTTLFTITSGLLLYKLYKENSTSPNRWLLLLVYANPFMLYLATEIRCYSLVILLSLVLISLFYKYYSNQKVTFWIRFFYVLISIIAVNTHYFLSFLLLSNGFYLLVKGYKKTLIAYLFDMAFVLVSLIWMPFFIFEQIHAIKYTEVVLTFQSMFMFIVRRFRDYLFATSMFPFQGMKYIILALIMSPILIQFRFKKNLMHFWVNNFYLLNLVVIISCCFLMLYPLLGTEFLGTRHTSILFPPLVILFLKLFDYLQNKYVKLLLIFIMFLFYSLSGINYYWLFVKDANFHDAIEYLTDNSKENESIILIDNQLARPFIYYYNGLNKTYILPYPIDISKPYEYELLTKPMNPDSVKRFFENISSNGNFWVLNFDNNTEWNDPNLNMLNSLIDSCFLIESDTLIADLKRNITYKSIQIRKLKP